MEVFVSDVLQQGQVKLALDGVAHSDEFSTTLDQLTYFYSNYLPSRNTDWSTGLSNGRIPSSSCGCS